MKKKEKLWEELEKIPKGEVVTYKELAKKLNSSPRGVSKMLSTNKNPIKVPCHRAVCSNGKIGGYTYKGKQNQKKKIELLKKEGVKIINGKVII